MSRRVSNKVEALARSVLHASLPEASQFPSDPYCPRHPTIYHRLAADVGEGGWFSKACEPIDKAPISKVLKRLIIRRYQKRLEAARPAGSQPSRVVKDRRPTINSYRTARAICSINIFRTAAKIALVTHYVRSLRSEYASATLRRRCTGPDLADGDKVRFAVYRQDDTGEEYPVWSNEIPEKMVTRILNEWFKVGWCTETKTFTPLEEPKRISHEIVNFEPNVLRNRYMLRRLLTDRSFHGLWLTQAMEHSVIYVSEFIPARAWDGAEGAVPVVVNVRGGGSVPCCLAWALFFDALIEKMPGRPRRIPFAMGPAMYYYLKGNEGQLSTMCPLTATFCANMAGGKARSLVGSRIMIDWNDEATKQAVLRRWQQRLLQRKAARQLVGANESARFHSTETVKGKCVSFYDIAPAGEGELDRAVTQCCARWSAMETGGHQQQENRPIVPYMNFCFSPPPRVSYSGGRPDDAASRIAGMPGALNMKLPGDLRLRQLHLFDELRRMVRAAKPGD